MSQAIATRAGPVSDKRAIITNGQLLRYFGFLDSWTQVRMGIQICFGGSATFAGTPTLILGALAGNVNGYADGAATTHFVGARVSGTATTWTYEPATKTFLPNNNAQIVKKIAAGITTGAFSGPAAIRQSGDTLVARCAVLVQITKGSPNFTVDLVGASSAVGASTDVTDAKFLALMEMANMSDASGIITGYGALGTGTIAVDEATNGSLDAINIFWDKSGVPMEISAVRLRKLS